jgi:hypothetical protein
VVVAVVRLVALAVLAVPVAVEQVRIMELLLLVGLELLIQVAVVVLLEQVEPVVLVL